jgi:hypothetical protein
MGYTNIVSNIIFERMWGRKMRKEYEKPILEVVEFEYDVSTQSVGSVDFDLSDSNWW